MALVKALLVIGAFLFGVVALLALVVTLAIHALEREK